MNEEEAKIRRDAIEFARRNKKLVAKRVACKQTYIKEDEPVSVFMAGSPGAGKTEASKALIQDFGGNILRIDADELRSEFVSYSGANSWLFQEAVSILVDRIHDVALKNKQSFVLDGTCTNIEKARLNIGRSLSRGRVVQLLYVYQEPGLAWAFAQAREKVEGRKILAKDFINQYFIARQVVNDLKSEFGATISMDLLLKNTDNSPKKYKANIDQVDSHICEQYSRGELEQLIQDE